MFSDVGLCFRLFSGGKRTWEIDGKCHPGAIDHSWAESLSEEESIDDHETSEDHSEE